MTKFIVALLAFATTAAIAQGPFTINIPTSGVRTCEPIRITWNGGTPPFYLVVRTPIGVINLGEVRRRSIVWTVNQAPGTRIGIDISDSEGQLHQSGDFTPSASTSTACL
ncbi:hypothetical protein BDV98DRAFT_658740 [Pterulicium gracile]|uniref:Uncharacterized protein n=1 Tax=Pterulicium gracile TaxID=1884261 RepID=A0A5C3Q4W4_9AGAR|nr:hypothetical protein BDV98DRAFT_658740 [Pterula gracilis]